MTSSPGIHVLWKDCKCMVFFFLNKGIGVQYVGIPYATWKLLMFNKCVSWFRSARYKIHLFSYRPCLNTKHWYTFPWSDQVWRSRKYLNLNFDLSHPSGQCDWVRIWLKSLDLNIFENFGRGLKIYFTSVSFTVCSLDSVFLHVLQLTCTM